MKYIRQHWGSLLMCAFLVLLLVSPGARSWVLRQLMVTGLFDAKIENSRPDPVDQTTIDFDFADEKGVVQNITDLRGKVIFINFWASWCPPCRAEFPSIETLYKNFKDNPEIFFLMITEDDHLSVAAEYLQKENFSVPLYQTLTNVPKDLYTGKLPTTIVLDKKGNIRYQKEGFANYSSKKFLKQIDDLIKE